MTPSLFLPVLDAAAHLLPSIDWSSAARVQLLATATQESGWTARVQIPSGAARSFFQMEKNGAVLNVQSGTRSALLLNAVCARLVIPGGLDDLFQAIAWNDVLATCMARLNYWLSPMAVPAMGDSAAALSFYSNTWRPAWFLAGQPEPGRWTGAYSAAMAAINGSNP